MNTWFAPGTFFGVATRVTMRYWWITLIEFATCDRSLLWVAAWLHFVDSLLLGNGARRSLFLTFD
jgi:hypothetical protein